MTLAWYDGVGLLGVLLVLLAYGLQQARRMDGHGLAFPLTNGVGALLILVALAYEPNLSAIAMELAWLAVSLYGIVRALAERRAARRTAY
jgi:hypothetical protein